MRTNPMTTVRFPRYVERSITLRLRSGEAADPLGYETKEQYQFIGSNKDDIFWGYGPHACPGRFSADA